MKEEVHQKLKVLSKNLKTSSTIHFYKVLSPSPDVNKINFVLHILKTKTELELFLHFVEHLPSISLFVPPHLLCRTTWFSPRK